MPDLTSPKIIIELLNSFNLRPKKDLGQHFLISRKVLEQIVKAAQLSPGDTILEIGPGLGVLTLALAKQAKKIYAVEQDKNLVKLLQANLEQEKLAEKVVVINLDILKFDIKILPAAYKLVANLPYQVTAPVLWQFLFEVANQPQHVVIMVQKEVANRLLAKPGNMSLISVLAQYYGAAHLVTNVKRTQFFPAPKVDSAVVQIIKQRRVSVEANSLFRLVKCGFASKRKKLKNNLLALGLSGELIVRALNQAELNINCRAQELAVDDWLNLHQILYNK